MVMAIAFVEMIVEAIS